MKQTPPAMLMIFYFILIIRGSVFALQHQSARFQASLWEHLRFRSLWSAVLVFFTSSFIYQWATIAKLSQTGWLKQQEFILSQFWRSESLEARWQHGQFLLGDSERGAVSRFPPSFWWLPSVPGIPWLVALSIQPLPSRSHGFSWSASVSVYTFPS